MLEARALARSLWRNRASAGAAIFMLAAAATAATTTFALADAVLWRDLPYREPWNLAMLVTTHVNGETAVSIPDLGVLRDNAGRARVAASGAFVPEYALTGLGEPRQLRARVLTAGYFSTLGVPLVAGREFTRAEEKTGSGHVVVLTDRLWSELFARGHEALGASLPLNGRSYTVVGILPPHRDPLGAVDIYVPQQFAPTLARRFRIMTPIARLTNGASLDGFSEEIRRLTSNTGDREAEGYTVEAVSLQERLASGVRSSVTFLFAGAVGLLVIALLNFAMLAAARAHQRMAEFSIRVAVGATPAAILRLAAFEAAVLASFGAALSVALSAAVVPLLRTRYGDGVVNEVGMGGRALTFLAIIAVVAVSVAIAAASRAFSRRLSTERVILSSRLMVGRTLVITQVGISLALVVSSALFARSFDELRKVDPGFRTAGIYATRMALPGARYKEPSARTTFWRTLLERLHEEGVEAAGISSELPLSGQNNPTSFAATMSSGESVPVKIRSVSPHYLQMLGIAQVAGRGFTASDGATAPRVVVVNQRLASSLKRLGDPIGQSLSFDFSGSPYSAQVVGVVKDIRHESLSASGTAEAYFPYDQTPLLLYSLVIAGPANERDVSARVRAALDTVDPGQPFGPVGPMTGFVAQDLARPRLQAQLVGFFAIVALVVAASGLYSLLAYLVAGSRREWAVRLALGASQGSLVKTVLRQSATYAVLGVTVGLAMLVAIGTTIKALLYGVSMWDPWVVFGCTGVMGAVCILSATIPAVRASRISAVEVLSA